MGGSRLPRTDLLRVIDPLQRELANQVQKHYQAVNVFYVEQGVAAPTDMRNRVRRTTAGLRAPRPGAGPIRSRGWPLRQAVVSPCGVPLWTPWVAPCHGCLVVPRHGGWWFGRRHRHDALIRARQRAQGVMGQLRRLLSQPVTGFDMTQAPPASAALAHALSAQRVQAETHYSGMVTIAEDYSPAAVVQVAGAVRERSAELKKKPLPLEKAIIEVVALMFRAFWRKTAFRRPCACGSPAFRCPCCVWRWPSRSFSATWITRTPAH